MPYTPDENLRFIERVSSEDLKPLVEIIAGKSDNRRWNEFLSVSDEYKMHGEDYAKYWQRILQEFQEYGGNSILNIFRDSGASYTKILHGVCKKMKVTCGINAGIVDREMALLTKILEKSLEKMTDEEKRKLCDELKIKTANPTGPVIMSAIQVAINAGGFMSYQIAVIVANAVLKTVIGRGLTFAANAALTRTIGIFAGPIGWAVSGIWLIFDLASPAYRVTIPGCVYIAYLRQKYSNTVPCA